MKGIRYTAEFKAEAIKQITERGYSAVEVTKRLGITDKSLYRWKSNADKRAATPHVNPDELTSLKSENARLNKALKRAEEERDILKKAAARSTGGCNTCIKFIGRRAKVQGFTWALI